MIRKHTRDKKVPPSKPTSISTNANKRPSFLQRHKPLMWMLGGLFLGVCLSFCGVYYQHDIAEATGIPPFEKTSSCFQCIERYTVNADRRCFGTAFRSTKKFTTCLAGKHLILQLLFHTFAYILAYVFMLPSGLRTSASCSIFTWNRINGSRTMGWKRMRKALF